MQKVKTVTDYQKNIDIELIILKLLETNTTREKNKVYTYLAADETGSLEITLWDLVLAVGDIILINDSYVSFFGKNKRLFVSGNGFVRRIGVFKKEFSVNPEHKAIIEKVDQ